MSLCKPILNTLAGIRVLPTEPNRELSLRLEVGNSQHRGHPEIMDTAASISIPSKSVPSGILEVEAAVESVARLLWLGDGRSEQLNNHGRHIPLKPQIQYNQI